MPCASVLNVNTFFFFFKVKYLLIDLCNNNCLPDYAYGLSKDHSGGLVVKTVKFISLQLEAKLCFTVCYAIKLCKSKK